MSKKLDIANKRFGKLTVLEMCDYRDKHRKTLWKCRCDCGKELVVNGSALTSGNTKSCGCVHKEFMRNLSAKHNESKSKLFQVWQSMKQRCSNKNSKSYKNYGGRGIRVCQEWCNDYIVFKTWAIENGYKEGLSIDRINNNGNYEPSNCRWTTRKVQNSNPTRTHYIEYNGKIYTMKELSNLLGINYHTFANRILTYKWTIEEAIKGVRNNENRKTYD